VARPAADTGLTPATLHDAVARLIGAQPAQTDRFGVAVSGGPDSMALLVLALDAFPGRVQAATVDHGLRAESATEAALVADVCHTLSVPHRILHPSAPIAGSLQAAARAARYAALEQWREDQRIDWLLTAHHADDQLETLVMRLNRASGLAGLSGIRARQGRVLRPLLAVRRADLDALVAAHGLPTVDDPSNRDPRFDRARIRAALAASDLLDASAAAASAAHLAQEEAALAWVTAELAAVRISSDGAACHVDMARLPPALRRRLLIAALTTAGEPAPRGEAVEGAMAAVARGAQAMIGNRLLSADSDLWTIRPAPPRRATTPRSD
jgi:tRNA(Ile)-lysidine synthase